MTSRTPEQLSRIEAAEEVQVSSHRPDGGLRPPVTIWVVGVGDEVFVRSAHGATNGWFRQARAAGTGRTRCTRRSTGPSRSSTTGRGVPPGTGGWSTRSSAPMRSASPCGWTRRRDRPQDGG
ncbi:DUF2255 family protein [Nakamurella sp. YIM 132084]|uniref:DUF2255 family protein n=1 Tax=Nakamurella leprariae TaxID=2803911 RepID=A0A938YHE7_9ACTN|nr:DUF2255 family protein [Nakamurella leprariae]